MKNILLLLIGFLISLSSYADGYKVTVKLKGLDCGAKVMLAYHYGEQKYLKDSVPECNNGTFIFRGEEKLEAGVYLIAIKNSNYFEFLVSGREDQMKYYFENDSRLLAENAITKNSKENDVFFEFNRFAAVKGNEADKLRDSIEKTSDEFIKKELIKQYGKIGEEVAKARKVVIEEKEGMFISTLYKSMQEVRPPEAPIGMPSSEVNTWKYLYVRDHFWDNVDLSEDGLVRSPVFHAKIKDFFNNYVPPIPDTAIALADRLIKSIEAAGSQEQFKYTVSYLLRHFQDLKYLCFDKAAYYIASSYYCTGKAYWTDSAFRADMCEQCTKMAPTLCGQIAPNVRMPDSTFSKRYSLYNVQAPVIILVFWDHDCGHCQKEIPIIQKFYDSCDKSEVFVFAVYTQGDWEGWKNYVKDKELTFLNVANAFGEDQFRDHYNIQTTPQIYVLNANKEIVFKKVGASDLPGIVQHLLEIQGLKEPGDVDGLEPSQLSEQEYED